LPQYRRSASINIGRRGGNAKILTGLRIVFNVDKTEGKDPNTARIEIYNLSEATRNLIDKNDQFIILNAGYLDGDGEELVFIGNIKSITHTIKKPEVITVITASDGDNALFNSKISISHDRGVSGDTILEQVLKAIPLSSNLSTISYTSKSYANGFAFAGLAKDALTKITKFLELEWSIQNNEIRLIPFDGDDKTIAVRLTPETGLIGSPERLTGSTRKAKGLSKKDKSGWKFRSLLQPKINPSNKVVVQSREIPNESTFTVYTVTHIGDTHGPEWETVTEVRE